MKLDRERAFGMVYGHQFASYEQDGKLFDGLGEEIVPEGGDREEPGCSAATWLSGLLSSGRKMKDAVAREATLQGYTGDELTAAYNELNIVVEKIAKVEYWKLPEQVTQ